MAKNMRSSSAAWLTAADAHESAGIDVNVLSRVAVPGASPPAEGVLADEEQAAAPHTRRRTTAVRRFDPMGEEGSAGRPCWGSRSASGAVLVRLGVPSGRQRIAAEGERLGDREAARAIRDVPDPVGTAPHGTIILEK